MAKYRSNLPLFTKDIFLTDGGLETTLIFEHEQELPEFAAFILLESTQGRQLLRNYFQKYIDVATQNGVGFILESPTWRANPSWGAKLGYSADQLDYVNRQAMELLSELRERNETEQTKILISGCIGPKGDGYSVGEKMTETEAEKFHSSQIATFSNTQADLVSAFTLSYIEEAIGITRAAKACAIPVVISFSVETDGKLASGMPLKEAVVEVDAATDKAPAYFMINCAHPTHFDQTAFGQEWSFRIKAVRANASAKSHAELDEAEELDKGDPVELARLYKRLGKKLPNLNVLGGCCGTDHRHVAEMCQAFL